MTEPTKLIPELKNYLQEFAGLADDWFAGRSFVVEYHQFFQEFFHPDKLEHATWSDFQSVADKLHSFNSVALAKSRAFGRPNYPIEKYREGFDFLAHGPGSVEDRMRAFMNDKEKYASLYLGQSVVSELIGQLFADKYVFMNRRDIDAAEFLGIKSSATSKDDFPAQFIKFNQALEPLVEEYRKIVGSRTTVPIGIEVDQFLSWLYENKIPKSPIEPKEKLKEPETRQIWVFAPGRQAKYWEECKSKSIVVYGADLLGALDLYESKDEIQKKIKELYSVDHEPTNDARAAWEFCRVMKEGDLIIAKKGGRKIVGVGIVKSGYKFDPDRTEYRNIREVEWSHQGEWLLPDGITFPVKTLTNITKYKDYVNKLFNHIGFEQIPASTKYFWLNCAPDVWRVSACATGEEQFYTTHNADGNKRQVYACFQTACPGDLVIGYETSPIQKVTTILEVIQGLHNRQEGESISFRIVEQLITPRSLAELRLVPALADCDPVKGKRQGGLFQLTKAEYDTIVTPSDFDSGIDEIYTLEDALEGLFIDEETFTNWLRQWQKGKNLILQGAPGVGKTYFAKRLAYALMEAEDTKRVSMVQFHQSYGYEDFVQGYRPGTNGFELRNGIFHDFCQQAKTDPRPYVFIIDEINRGNLSRIFGELMMLIEPDKRGEDNALRLAYQEEGQTFFVPENVYILGMMNTADRSLAVVDYALRRRFHFVTLLPAFDGTYFREYLSEACGDDLANNIIQRLKRLNEEINQDMTNLGPGFCIGHSYFCCVQNIETYREVIHFQVAPLLREYWFDQPRKAEEQIQNLLSL